MAQQSLLFSIIIPTHNRAKLLKRSIQSIIDQTYTKWELIIIDDGSIDNTANAVLEFQDERVHYFYQDHKERSTARNVGIDNAVGKYVCFVDDDDYVTEKYLQDFFEYYKENNYPEIILRTGFMKMDGNSKKKSVNYHKGKHKNPVKYAAYNMCGVWSLAIPRKFFENERFPEPFPHWQDTHLILRLFMKYRMEQLQNYNYNYIIHERMGSKRATIDFDPIERADLNVAAIEDLFENEKDRIYRFVPKNTLSFLRAEKYLEYAISSSFNFKVLGKSIQSGVYLRSWKLYLFAFASILKSFLKTK